MKKWLAINLLTYQHAICDDVKVTQSFGWYMYITLLVLVSMVTVLNGKNIGFTSHTCIHIHIHKHKHPRNTSLGREPISTWYLEKHCYSEVNMYYRRKWGGGEGGGTIFTSTFPEYCTCTYTCTYIKHTYMYVHVYLECFHNAACNSRDLWGDLGHALFELDQVSSTSIYTSR